MSLAVAARLQGHKDAVLSVAARADAVGVLCSGSVDKTARIWDVRARPAAECVRVIKGFPDAVASVAWGEGGGFLYAAAGCKVFAYDLRQPNVVLSESIHTYAFNDDEVNQIRINSKGELLAACDDAGEVRIIDLKRHTLNKTLKGQHTSICSCICFRPQDPSQCITGGMDCSLVFWDYMSGRPKHAVDTGSLKSDGAGPLINPPMVNDVCASEDGRLVACALGDCSAAVFTEKVVGGKKGSGPARKRRVLEQSLSLQNGHTAGVASLRFLPRVPLVSLEEAMGSMDIREESPSSTKPVGPLLATGGNDKVICLWDLHAAPSSAQTGATDPLAAPGLLAKISHGQKVNDMCTGWLSASQTHICVADPTPVVTLYSVNV